MLKIRLARTGKKKQAQYRVVVADQRRAVTAKFNEILGWYNPHSKEFKVNTEKVEEWLGKGAQPSNTLAILLKKNGVKLPDWVKIEEKNKKPKNAEVAKPETQKTQNDNAESQSEVVEDAKEETPNPESVETEAEDAEPQNEDEKDAKEETPSEDVEEAAPEAEVVTEEALAEEQETSTEEENKENS